MKYIEYREKLKHGTDIFPVAFYRVNYAHPRYEMPHHWHREYELIRIIHGELNISLDETKFTARQGDILFIHDGILHGAVPVDCTYECLVYDLNLLCTNIPVGQKFVNSISNHDTVITPLFPRQEDKVHEIIHRLFNEAGASGPAHELAIFGLFFELYGALLADRSYLMKTSAATANRKRIRQLKKALEVIETSYASPLSLQELAAAAEMNEKYFCRFFHEMTGRTPIGYLNYYRIEQACLLLSVTEQSVTDIALNCGFNDISYFIKTFRKYKGTTPKKYLSSPF